MKYIEQAYQLKLQIDALRPLKKEDEMRIMQKLRLDWNYHSNHIEGNSLTCGETKYFILHGITAGGKPLKDHIEILGHNEAVEWITEVVKTERPLTENFIRELHNLILKNPYEKKAVTPSGEPTTKQIKIGEYKSSPNHVRTSTGEIFYFATPEETPAKMFDLMNWYREKTDNQDSNPILVAAEFHYRFIRIHPFDDGNGRTARMIMNFILMKYGYPPTVIKTEDKANYLNTLRQADAGDLLPFVEYIAKNLIHSLEIMLKGAKGENIEEPDDFEKEIALLEQKLKSLSAPVQITRNQEIIATIYNDSVKRLSESFYERGKVLNRFYIENNYDGWKNTENVPEIVSLKYEYKTFNMINYQPFDYQSFIAIRFEITKYKIVVLSNVILEKPYTEQLSEEEITNIVDFEMKEHKKFIEKNTTAQK